ncbi:MAG TPA: DUF6596 domain-containing protein [Chitinophagaceae bacterium]|nr:DUF6596 domain-containing protein [Chitinophagaceae bacterium]
MGEEGLIPHLFRTEYRKIVAVLCRYFGFAQVEAAEDIASETFLTAVQSWGIDGVPANPPAWLYSVAKNKAKNYMHRAGIFEKKVSPVIKAAWGAGVVIEEVDLSPQNIIDSQLQMIFAICHPAIAAEAQVGLALRVLCGFGIEEIADAFLTNKETINKRLYRAREKLREERISIEMPGETDLNERLGPVLTTVYLLFNEGYYSVSQNNTLRKDLCLEAMRLCTMLVENEHTNKPQVNALMALMCFHASRFDARLDANGEIVLYDEQDPTLWNMDLISKGAYFMQQAAKGGNLTKYHLEAGIAYWATQKEDTIEKWENILLFYDRLLQVEHSPIAALNRVYAQYKAQGAVDAIPQAEQLQLTGNHFYYMLLGELYSGMNLVAAEQNFRQALALAKTQAERLAIQKKIARLQKG